MATRRWSWLREKLATEGLTANLSTSANPAAAARYAEIDIVATPAMPTNGGVGTNQDAVIVCPADVVAVLASAPTVEVISATSGAAMTTCIITRQYVAASLGLGLPGAIVLITGTGLVTP